MAGRTISTKAENKAPVTDQASWLKITETVYDTAVRLGLFEGTEEEFIVSLSAASEEAAQLAAEQTEQCKTATATAAASNATSGAQYARQSGQKAEEQTAAASTVIDAAQEKSKKLDQVIKEGQQQINSMRALEENISNYVQSAPTRMELSYLEVITPGNAVQQRIEAKLYPAYVLQNVLFLPAGGEDVLTVYPDGRLEIHKAGTAKVHIIPTHNIGLYRAIEITVQEPAMLFNPGGEMLLDSNGNIILGNTILM